MDNSAQDVVAANVRHFRKAAGWTLEELSDHLKASGYPMSVKVLSKTENAQRAITVDDLVAFAQVFDQHVERLTTPPQANRASGMLQAVYRIYKAEIHRDEGLAEIDELQARLKAAEQKVQNAEAVMRRAEEAVRTAAAALFDSLDIDLSKPRGRSAASQWLEDAGIRPAEVDELRRVLNLPRPSGSA